MEEKYNKLAELLDTKDSNVVNYINYCKRSELEKTKDGQPKNYHFKKLSAETLAELYKRVESEGLVLDGKHITIQSTGLSYDYVAYKNKMLITYPESLIDLQLVYKEDKFNVAKNSGKVIYNHEIVNPFSRSEKDIIGGYCVIKNKRGEFITTLNSSELNKHKAVAKTSYIWNNWFSEMCMKTIIKKAVKYHFEDIYNKIEEDEDSHIDLEKPTFEVEEELSKCKTNSQINDLWKKLTETQQSKYLDKFNKRKDEI